MAGLGGRVSGLGCRVSMFFCFFLGLRVQNLGLEGFGLLQNLSRHIRSPVGFRGLGFRYRS